VVYKCSRVFTRGRQEPTGGARVPCPEHRARRSQKILQILSRRCQTCLRQIFCEHTAICKFSAYLSSPSACQRR
jgi:hypothetical protein